MKNRYDTIVIGLGAMGAATVYQLAKRGCGVLGIDQFNPPHTQGSTHGDSRITRQATAEGEEYVPLVLRSYDIWKEIENETGADLLTFTGGLIMASYGGQFGHHGRSKFLEQTIDTAKKYNIKHELLNTQEIKHQFPQFNLAGNEEGYFEDMAGFLRPENCIKAQLELGKKYGAHLNTNEKVIKTTVTDKVVHVITDKGEYFADKVIVSAGSWVNEFLPAHQKSFFEIYRQVLYWFDIKDNFESYLPENFPVFIWKFGKGHDDFIYGLPALSGRHGGLKIATEQYQTITSPEEVNREVSQDEINSMYDYYIKKQLPDLSSKCVNAMACLYTVTPDSNFVIDYHPEHKEILIASPCSGHGFKHSAAIGEVLSQLVLDGKSKIDISKFSFNMLANSKKQ